MTTQPPLAFFYIDTQPKTHPWMKRLGKPALEAESRRTNILSRHWLFREHLLRPEGVICWWKGLITLILAPVCFMNLLSPGEAGLLAFRTRLLKADVIFRWQARVSVSKHYLGSRHAIWDIASLDSLHLQHNVYINKINIYVCCFDCFRGVFLEVLMCATPRRSETISIQGAYIKSGCNFPLASRAQN